MSTSYDRMILAKGALFASVAAGILLLSPGAQAQSGYTFEAELKVPGEKVTWDYMNFDPVNRRVYMARRVNGVTVYSPDDKKIVGNVEKSEGANGVALIPDLNRGYTSNDNGTSTVFDLKTLKFIETVKDGDDNDANTYDPFSKRVIFVNADSGTATFVNTADNKIAGKVPLESKKAEFPSPDGNGKLFVAIQDKNEVSVIDTKEMKQVARWSTGKCQLPTSTRVDAAAHRLFVGCRSDAPMWAAINTDTGAVVATVPIGRGNDAQVWDADTKTIYASNGVDANVNVIKQKSPDSYELVETIATRPQARTMALDPKTKKIYLVTATFLPPPTPGGRALAKPDSFVMLSYAPK